MPTPPKKKPLVTSWSWSRYAQYNQCPAMFKYKNIDKLPEPGGPAMQRGKQIHDLADNFTRGLIRKLPVELGNFKAEFAMLKKVGAKTEADARIGLDRAWKPVDYFDWNACWLRVVIDAKYEQKIGKTTNRMVVIDHKTGKVYGDNAEQLDLTATAALAANPKVDEVEVQLWYLDQGLILPEKPKVYGRETLAKKEKEWEKKVYPLLTDKKFVPTPNDGCRRCHFRKSNGGPCRY